MKSATGYNNTTNSVRVAEVFRAYQRRISAKVDRMLASLLAAEWIGAIAVAWIFSPATWEGGASRLHPHIVTALLLGPALVILPALLAFRHSGRVYTRHVIAAAQMIMSALLIGITNGRIETHFHIFGSLAFLAFYRDWKVLLTASLITGLDHFISGIWWPSAVYGITTSSPWRWVEHTGWVGFEDVFLVLSFRQIVREMWIVARREVRLAHGAHHDVLTGLPNRRLLLERFQAQQAAGARTAVFFVDLDRFKQVNDTLGHAVGDKLLVTVAARLAALFPAGDTLARVGGDEFVVVSVHAEDAAIQAAAESILAVFTETFEIDEHRLLLSASVGVSISPDHGLDLTGLQAAADKAMYEAKAQGRGRWALFTSALLDKDRDRRDIENDLAFALARNQLEVNFQPQVSSDETILGFEALMRWKHPRMGYVSPSEFIPRAEASGLIVPLGEWILKRACEACAEWHRNGHPTLTVAVNVSAVQFEEAEFFETVFRAVRTSGIEPEALTLELTETALMKDVAGARNHLRNLRGLGVRVALDDFGTGYSSLRYLESLPADSIKLDNAFIGRASAGPPVMLRSVMELAHRNGLRVTAEGIETVQQSSMLREMGCDYLQGYFYGHPMAAEAVTEYLSRIGQCESRNECENADSALLLQECV